MFLNTFPVTIPPAVLNLNITVAVSEMFASCSLLMPFFISFVPYHRGDVLDYRLYLLETQAYCEKLYKKNKNGVLSGHRLAIGYSK